MPSSCAGGGIFDGQGWRWWPYGKTRPRPLLIDISLAYNLSISNLTLLDSPSFHIQARGYGMSITHMNITANGNECGRYDYAPNTDGINIGGHDIYVADCFVHNGDDCVPTNTGPLGDDSYNILVERVHCECGTNGGVPIVANGAAVRDVVYRDMTVVGTNQGAGFKISEAYENVTGSVVNVTWSNITIHMPRYAAMYGNVFAEDANACVLPSNPNRTHWLTATNITYSDVTAVVGPGTPAGCFVCSSSRPCTGYVFNNVVVTSNTSSQPAPYTCFNMLQPISVNGTTPVACAASADGQ